MVAWADAPLVHCSPVTCSRVTDVIFFMLRIKQMIPLVLGWTLPVVNVTIHIMVTTADTTLTGTSVGSLAIWDGAWEQHCFSVIRVTADTKKLLSLQKIISSCNYLWKLIKIMVLHWLFNKQASFSAILIYDLSDIHLYSFLQVYT